MDIGVKFLIRWQNWIPCPINVGIVIWLWLWCIVLVRIFVVYGRRVGNTWCVVDVSKDTWIYRISTTLLPHWGDNLCCKALLLCTKILLDKIPSWNLFSSVIKNLVTAGCPCTLKWTKHTHIKWLQFVSGVRWKAKKNNIMFNSHAMKFHCFMWAMSIQNDKYQDRGILAVCCGLRDEWSAEPLFPYKIISPAIRRSCKSVWALISLNN